MKRLMLATLAGAALLAGAGAASAQTFHGDGYGATYGYSAPDYGYSHSRSWNSSAPRGGTYKMNSFKAQEVMPQSPPAGGY